MQMQQQHHHHHRPNTTHLVPLSNYDVTELKLENGQLAMHGLGGLLPTAPEKPIWGIKAGDTLESIVHQATCHKREQNSTHHDRTPANTSSMVASSGGGGGRTWTGDSGQPVPVPVPQGWTKKRTRPQASDSNGKFFCSCTTSNIHEEHADPSACTASARFCRDNTTMNTWASFESPPSLKTKSTDEDSASHGGLENQEEERREITTKGDESGLSHSTRPRRVAAIHNQSERKRRDRINQKMKALQRLVPNASKTDKASMLDEVIKYLEQLKAQVQMLSSVRNMPHMMMPLGMQQHLHQMSVLQAHMSMGTRTVGPVGLGMGMGMLDIDTVARMASHQQLLPPLPLIHHPAVAAAAPTFMNPPFMVPPHPTSAQAKPDPASANTTNASGYPLPDPYNALLTQQTMNMELFNRMAELYSQQVNRTTGATSSPSSQSYHVQGD